MTKKELISKSDISSEDYNLMKNNIDVSLSTLRMICKLFNYDYSEIIKVLLNE